MRELCIIIPTRKRFDSIVRCVEAFHATCDDPESFEVMIGFDNDDPTHDDFKGYVESSTFKNIRIFRIERIGWARLMEYHCMMTAQRNPATQWVSGWTDDMMQVGKGWDTALKSFSGQFVFPWWEYDNDGLANATFPYITTVPVEWVVLFPEISPHRQGDWFFNEIVKDLGLYRKHPALLCHNFKLPSVDNGEPQHYINRMTSAEERIKNSMREKLSEHLKGKNNAL